jgi:CelD/BcsL family acetyltransferase involved in cellulose biosynthesis
MVGRRRPALYPRSFDADPLGVLSEKTATRVIEMDPRTDRRWDEFVRSHPDATAYHLSDWAEILERAYRHSPRYLALADGDELRAVLPAFMSRGVMSGRRLRSMPIVNGAGPLGSDEDRATLLSAACDRIEALDGRLYTVQSRLAGPEQLDPRLREVTKQPAYVAAVPHPDELHLKLWKKRSRNLYRGVSRAIDNKLMWREAEGRADLRRWYRLYLATMRKRRIVPYSWRQIETTRRLLEPRGEFRLFVVEREDRLFAGVVCLVFGDTVELVYNGSDPEELEVRPNHLLNWGVLGWASRQGLARMDIGDATPGGPLARFKEQFGAVPVPDYRWDYVVGGPSVHGRARAAVREMEYTDTESLTARAWARVPLPALRAAGTAIYRYV